MKYKVVFLLAILGILTIPAISRANANKSVYLPSGTTIDGNYYGAGDTVEIAGAVASDLIVAGGNVVIKGAVGGDAIVAGGNVRIIGPISGNVRVVGGNVEIVGTVARNVTVGAGSLVIAESADIAGHITSAAGSLEIRGKVQGSVLSAAGTVILSGEVKGPITLYFEKEGSFEIRETAKTGGAINYYGSKSASVSAGAQLQQSPEQHAITYKTNNQGWWWRYLISLFSALVLGMVLVYLIPTKVKEVIEEAISRPLPSLGWGALWAFVTPIIIIILMVTVIGLPIAIVLLAVYIIGLVLAPVIAGAAIGSYIQSRFKESWLSKQSFLVMILIGIFIYRLVVFIPILGHLIGFFGALWAWGAILQVQQRLLKTFR